jgi:hypothetical protein
MLIPLSFGLLPLSDCRSRAHSFSIEGHADVVFAGASLALVVKRGSWDQCWHTNQGVILRGYSSYECKAHVSISR